MSVSSRNSSERVSVLIQTAQRRGTRNGKHKKLSSLSQRTWHVLGSENLKEAIKCPPGEDMNEWIAANTFDFLNEINILWGHCIDQEAHSRYLEPGSGFPKGVTYRWSNDRAVMTGPDYVEVALIWIDDQCANPDIFPDTDTNQGTNYPENFVEIYVKKIFVKLFRIFCIIYWSYKDDMGEHLIHLNTCFRHYIYFALEHNLLPEDEKEIMPIEDIVTRLKSDFARKTILPPKKDKK
mmetsp:Transcript_16533/g.18688  ORF Transcript_16533/g.18688 Transcript_16533/m.18688 type:complete len:237 (-) Transcript_16533:309-1019(-)|eukprot:CAMPEP_0184018810 /NCGR_PEP_ID=MMETSP0954-20121128/8370_1 /TAXON_ID=627963 /ORGANISM="Aplanochytrium sp, Strain PBS07" /LENGTH=236 /DNA_ID=CAMNT_0026300341 /DNA_START=641 /DNA_END=1351 /DNA_ORIENTATION=-